MEKGCVRGECGQPGRAGAGVQGELGEAPPAV